MAEAWRAEIMRRKYERLKTVVAVMQRLSRCTLAAHYLRTHIAMVAATRKAQAAWRRYRTIQQWKQIAHMLKVETAMRNATAVCPSTLVPLHFVHSLLTTFVHRIMCVVDCR